MKRVCLLTCLGVLSLVNVPSSFAVDKSPAHEPEKPTAAKVPGPHKPSSKPLITAFTMVDGCKYFSPEDLNEATWAKNEAKKTWSFGTPGQPPVYIAKVDLQSKLDKGSHVAWVCYLDTSSSKIDVSAGSIKSIGDYDGVITIRSNSTKNIKFTLQAARKSHGFHFVTEFWGTYEKDHKAGAPNPFIRCANPNSQCAGTGKAKK